MDRVPTEIQKLILNLCDDRTRRIARLSCRDWFNYIDYRSFAIYLTKKSEWPQIVDRLCSYSKPISLHFRKNIMKNIRDINEHLQRLTNLTNLTLDDLDPLKDQVNETEGWLKLTALTNLYSVQVVNHQYHVPDPALLSFKHLTKLDARTHHIIRIIGQLTDLQSCSIDTTSMGVDLFERSGSKLTYLSISGGDADKNVVENMFKYCSNIQTLELSIGNTNGDISLKALTELRKLVCLAFSSQLHELNSTQLTSLELYFAEEEYTERVVDKLMNLKELIYYRFIPDMNFVADEIDNNEDNNEVFNNETADESGDELVDAVEANEKENDFGEDYDPDSNDSRVDMDIKTLDDQPRTFSYEWLSSLTSLQYLNIDKIEGDGLAFVPSQIEKLQISVFKPLNLSHVSRFGSLKELYILIRSKELDDLSVISQLTGLKCLQIQQQRGRARLNFPLSVFTNLEWLDLERVSGDISNLPNLEHLVLTPSAAEGFEGTGLPKLTALQFRQDYLCQEPPLNYSVVSSLTTLKSLGLHSKQVYNCSYFSMLTALVDLNIQQICSEQDYNYLARLTQLTSLHIWFGLPSNNILQLPTSLQRLHMVLTNREEIDVTDITDQLIARLPNLYNLYIK